MSHNTRTYNINLPFDGVPLEPSKVQELLRKMVETYQEFAHVNFDVTEEEEKAVQYFTDTRTQGVRVFPCRESEVYDAWYNSIVNASRKLTREEADVRLPVLKTLTYDLQRAMSTPIDGVEQSIIEDSDGTYKVINKPKYYTF